MSSTYVIKTKMLNLRKEYGLITVIKVDITISKNQALQILYLGYSV